MAVKDSAGRISREGAMVSVESQTRVAQTANVATVAAGAATFNCALQSVFYKTGGPAGTQIYNLTNLAEGQTVTIVVVSIAGVYTITWQNNGVANIKWPGASVPTPTGVASRRDVYTFIRIGGEVFGTAALNCG
jgi:hypothetical protein